MDQRIADGLVDGRAQFRAGKRKAAIATWKDTLRVAYETQNQAAAFALSKTLGDAVLESSHQDAEGMTQAVGYFEYALQLLDACELHADHVYYPPLENVVRYLRRRRRRALRLIQDLATGNKNASTRRPPPVSTARKELIHEQPVQEDTAIVCSTCELPGRAGNPIIVDDADRCHYCQACYDDYYAHATQDAIVDGASSAVEPVDDTEEEDPVSTTQAVVLTVSVASDPVVHEQFATEEVPDHQRGIPDEERDVDRADRKSHFDSMQLPVGAQHSGSVDKLTMRSIDEANGVGGMASADQTAQCLEVLVDTKFVYTIAELVALRRFDLPCPAVVKHCPVALGTGTPPSTHSRNQKQAPRHAKSTPRSTKNDRSCSEAAVSAFLPSLAECEAVALTTTSPTTQQSALQLASAFFNTPDGYAAVSLETQLHVFAATAGSFATTASES